MHAGVSKQTLQQYNRWISGLILVFIYFLILHSTVGDIYTITHINALTIISR